MDNLLVKLYQSLDMAVFSKENHGFKLRSLPPAWLSQLVSKEDLEKACNLDELFPFIDCCLPSFEYHWESQNTEPLLSDTWIETTEAGYEIPLEATAIYVEGTAFILLQNLGEKYEENVEMLQKARDNLLIKEMLEAEVAKRIKEIKQREEEIAHRLSSITSYRDSETGNHVRRIGFYAAVMGKALGWSKEKIDDIRIAAPMHDIGKISIADSILLKAGRLTDEEFSTMQCHTTVGANMLKGSNIPVLDMAADIALSHHEKWDGSGYPNGLSGEDIPESARITAIIDIYDALVHKRVYKDAMDENEAVGYLQEISGQHIDPNLFTVFVEQLPAIRAVRELYA